MTPFPVDRTHDVLAYLVLVGPVTALAFDMLLHEGTGFLEALEVELTIDVLDVFHRFLNKILVLDLHEMSLGDEVLLLLVLPVHFGVILEYTLLDLHGSGCSN